MQTIQLNRLSQITGGAAVAAWSPANGDHFAGSVINRTVTNFQQSKYSNGNMNEFDPTASHCGCVHAFTAPQNGDRNALGQQYSWGTWWDDMN